MIGRNIALAASLALAVEAFMIPSTMSLPDLDMTEEGAGAGEFNALRLPDDMMERLESLHTGMNRIGGAVQVDDNGVETTKVTLACPDCATALPGFETVRDDEEIGLDLEFLISPKDNTLVLNHETLYPSPDSAKSVRTTINTPLPWIHEGDMEVASRIHTVNAADGTDAKLVDLNLEVTSYDARPVNIKGVSIRMLEDETGKLRLIHVITSPSAQSPPNGLVHAHGVVWGEGTLSSPQDEVDCPAGTGLSVMLCRLRNRISDKVKAWRLTQPNPAQGYHLPKPCGKHPVGFSGQKVEELRLFTVKGGPPKFSSFQFHDRHDREGHHQHRHHHDHKMRGFVHAFASGLRSFVISFLMPVMIGVMAGMTASLLGMLVGTFIAWVWVKFVRGGKRGNATARQEAREASFVEDDDVVVAEKEALLDHAPAYDAEDLPAYVEKE